jgi:hypothetical protein
MSLFIKLLPVVFLSIILSILFNNLYPKYKLLIEATKNLNEATNKKVELSNIEKLIQAISQNANIQQLVNNKEVLDLWLPQEPKTEDILLSLIGIYQSQGFIFSGVNFNFGEIKNYNPNVLPVRTINFELSLQFNKDNYKNDLSNFISSLEQNTRLMNIKQVSLTPDGKAKFVVESYYLSEK